MWLIRKSNHKPSGSESKRYCTQKKTEAGTCMYQTIGPDSKSGKEAAHMVTRAAKRSKISQSVSDDNTKTVEGS